MSLLGAALTSLPPEEIIQIVAEYAPVIEELIRLMELHKDEKVRALSMNDITRGLQYARESGDTTELAKAFQSHCDSSRCRFP